MLIGASCIGIVATISGYYLATLVNGSIAGAIATSAGVIFFFVFLYTVLGRKTRQPALWETRKTSTTPYTINKP